LVVCGLKDSLIEQDEVPGVGQPDVLHMAGDPPLKSTDQVSAGNSGIEWFVSLAVNDAPKRRRITIVAIEQRDFMARAYNPDALDTRSVGNPETPLDPATLTLSRRK